MAEKPLCESVIEMLIPMDDGFMEIRAEIVDKIVVEVAYLGGDAPAELLI